MVAFAAAGNKRPNAINNAIGRCEDDEEVEDGEEDDAVDASDEGSSVGGCGGDFSPGRGGTGTTVGSKPVTDA